MTIKSGAFLSVGNGVVVDRLQSAGPGSLNIPSEKIYELGNWRTVATVYDIPDLSFDMESFDVSAEIEALITGVDSTSIVDGQEFDFGDAVPFDVLSPFKSSRNQYDIVKGVIVPYLTLERVVYRFGLKANAAQQYTLRGDSIYYLPGVPYRQTYTNVGTGAYALAHPANLYIERGTNVYALCVTLVDSVSHEYKRLLIGDDYTNTANNFTLLADLSATYDTVTVCYGSLDAATYPQTVHQGVSVKPAAVRGKDIDVYVGTNDATPVFTRWTGVQSAEVTRSVNITNEEEFGNHHYISSDYDVAEVSGTITIRPENPNDLYDKVAEIADVGTGQIVGPNTTVAVPVEIRISDPNTGVVLKTLYVPDARCTLPAVQGRVQQPLDIQIAFSSDEGILKVYSGVR